MEVEALVALVFFVLRLRSRGSGKKVEWLPVMKMKKEMLRRSWTK